MKNPYYPTALGLYFNYLVHGMGVILMSLNMASLETLWQTNAAGVSIVISSLGIGRLSVLLFAGLLSDRFGRRPFIMLGMCCYMAFFFGILHTNNIIIAYVFGFLAGMANSFLDAGTYPSLMEAFPRSPGTANILIKAFVSSGQFLLPLIISLLVWAELWFGWSFMIAALLKKMVRPIWANVFNSALATITAAIIYLYPSPLVCNAGAFVIGFSAAGGILQLGVSVMSEFFPKSKAKVTSIYMMMGGLANFVIPLITGYLSNIGLQYIIVLDFTFALLALITAIIVFIRYYRVFIIPENDVRFGEHKFSTRLNTIKHRG